MKIEEPYEYRGRLTLPKYIVNSSGDQFFLPDSSQFYYDDLLGDKYLRYVPNTDHGLGGSDAPQSFMAWYNAIVYGKPIPKITWTYEKDGSIVAKTQDKPTQVLLWQATNPNTRDFRKVKIGKAYKSTPLQDQGNGTYVAKVPKPETGFTAYYIEFEFPSGLEKAPFKFSTGIRVIPDVLPFKHKI
jgi:PhoPQ-activated pathogenicity-related protein